MTPTEKAEMHVDENQDGSAVVQLSADQSPNDIDDDHDEGDNTPETASNVDDGEDQGVSPDREAIRAARREERQLKKHLHREKARESNHLISALRKQNQALAERIAIVEKHTSGAELARVDKAIEDASVQVEFAKMKMQESVNSRNGAELTKAQELWFDSRRKLESLQMMKDTATRSTQQSQQNIPDPVVQKMASDWVERNPWYDPQGKNIESSIAQKIDKQLHEEGFDPVSEDYWEELDGRMQKYLPDSKSRVYNAPTGQTERRRSTMTSSGRDSMPSAKPGEFILSPDRVAAMKEGGLWDNPKLRQKAIDNYRSWDRNNRNQRS